LGSAAATAVLTSAIVAAVQLPMRCNLVLSSLVILAACGGSTEVSFGEPKTVASDRRPLAWGLSTRDRLGVSDMPKANAGAGGQQAAAAATSVEAATPAGWERLPAKPQRFRDAVWQVAGASDTDCYLTLGVGGGVASNLQRWYMQQFGKPSAPAVEDLPEVAFCGREGRLVELEGAMGAKQDWAMLIAFFHQGQQVTSLKFTGPKAVLAEQRDAFLSLAGSIRLVKGRPAKGQAAVPVETHAPGPVDPSAPLPPGHAPVGRPQQAPFTAQTPAGWTAKAGSRRVLHHAIGAGTEVYLSQLGGDLRQTLDIWRFELQLQAMTDAEFAALPRALFLGDDAVLMDLTGSWQGMTGGKIEDARVLVAARLDGDTITFCKLVGPRGEVGAHRDAFVQFCGSVRRR